MTTVWIPHHAGWLTSNMLMFQQHTDLGSIFSLYRTIKTAGSCNHEISDVSTVLGIPEEARMKKRSRSEEFSTKIGDEKPAKMRIEPTNRMYKIGITAPTKGTLQAIFRIQQSNIGNVATNMAKLITNINGDLAPQKKLTKRAKEFARSGF